MLIVFFSSQDLQTSLLNQAAYFAAGSVYSHGLFATPSSSSTNNSMPPNNPTFIHH